MFDLEESIVEVEGNEMMLMEFVEANEGNDAFAGRDLLHMLHNLITKSRHEIFGGVGEVIEVKLVRLADIAERCE